MKWLIALSALLLSGCSMATANRTAGWLFHDYEREWQMQDARLATCCCDKR